MQSAQTSTAIAGTQAPINFLGARAKVDCAFDSAQTVAPRHNTLAHTMKVVPDARNVKPALIRLLCKLLFDPIPDSPTQTGKSMKSLSSNRNKGLAGAIGIAVLFLAGCASTPAPTEQMAVSRSAVANAVSAGGTEYAPDDMRTAQDKMNRAYLAMKSEDFKEARWLAEEAQADARLAEKKAQSAKAQHAAATMRDDIRVLREEINRKSPTAVR